ncbi:hypothetical protein D3C76_1089470 [compost metagenome]
MKTPTASPQPTAQALCTVPMTLPRYLGLMVSAINTAPAAHSPPIPKPCNALTINNWWKPVTNADRKVKNENHKIIHCSVRTRP